jgi:hypothetical protein
MNGVNANKTKGIASTTAIVATMAVRTTFAGPLSQGLWVVIAEIHTKGIPTSFIMRQAIDARCDGCHTPKKNWQNGKE